MASSRVSFVPKAHKHSIECRLLSLDEAAAYTGYSLRTARHYCNSGIWPGVKLGYHSWRIRLCELDAWISDRAERVARGQIVPT